MTAETIAKALGGRKAGGGWTASCPAHDDQNPSLSIRDADDGKVLVRCHAGCDQEQVIATLRSLDLWTESRSRKLLSLMNRL
jgi:putative DNA primase/helicase